MSIDEPIAPSINFIGDIYCDIMISEVIEMPKWGEDALGKTNIFAGGSSLNSIVHAKGFCDAAGMSVNLKLFSSVSEDMQGKLCLDFLKSQQIAVDTISQCKTSESSTGTCVVFSGQRDRCFISDRGCVALQSYKWFDESKLFDCNHLHLGGFYNCSTLLSEAVELFSMVSPSSVELLSLVCTHSNSRPTF